MSSRPCVTSSCVTSWGEGASLALVDHPSSDGVKIKIPYGVDVSLHQPASLNLFLLGLLKLLGKWTLVVAVFNADAYSFLAFSHLTCQLEDTRIGVFWLQCAA